MVGIGIAALGARKGIAGAREALAGLDGSRFNHRRTSLVSRVEIPPLAFGSDSDLDKGGPPSVLRRRVGGCSMGGGPSTESTAVPTERVSAMTCGADGASADRGSSPAAVAASGSTRASDGSQVSGNSLLRASDPSLEGDSASLTGRICSRRHFQRRVAMFTQWERSSFDFVTCSPGPTQLPALAVEGRLQTYTQLPGGTSLIP